MGSDGSTDESRWVERWCPYCGTMHIARVRPAYQFYPDLEDRETALRLVGLAAFGLWHRMLNLMHEAVPRGWLVTAAGVPIEPDELARLIGEPPAGVKKLLAELEAQGVFSRTDNGIIFCRKMVRDEHTLNARAAGGAKSLANPNVPRPKDAGKDGGKGYPSKHPRRGSSGGSPAPVVADAAASATANPKSGSGEPAHAPSSNGRSPNGTAAAAPTAPLPGTPASNGKQSSRVPEARPLAASDTVRERVATIADRLGKDVTAGPATSSDEDDSDIIVGAAALPMGAMLWFYSHYGDSPLERQRDVLLQLLQSLTTAGAKLKGNQRARAYRPERLAAKCLEMRDDPPLRNPDAAIYVLLTKLADTSDGGATGQVAEVELTRERTEEAKLGAERLRLATAWLSRQRATALEIERELPVGPDNPAYRLMRDCAIIDAWERAGSPGDSAASAE